MLGVTSMEGDVLGASSMLCLAARRGGVRRLKDSMS